MVVRKLLITALLFSLLTLFLSNNGLDYLSFESLKLHKHDLLDFTHDHFWLSFLITGFVYVLSTVLNLPGAAIMSLAIGFIFGRWYGVLLATIASTLGAVLVFLLAHYLIADWARSQLEKVNATKGIMEKLQGEEFSYLLFMRAVPLFPFWFVNMVFSFSSISTKNYAIGTCLGMLPVSFVLVNLGQSLSTVHSMDELFTGEVILSFTLIGLLALATITALHIRKRRTSN